MADLNFASALVEDFVDNGLAIAGSDPFTMVSLDGENEIVLEKSGNSILGYSNGVEFIDLSTDLVDFNVKFMSAISGVLNF